MPYRHAWMFIAALIAATVFAFWRSYFGMLGTAPLGFHLHGITAALWMLLLLAQSWTPHRGGIALHRALGRATFVATPLFAAGAMGVIHSMAAATAAGDPFYALWGAPLATIDVLAFGTVLYATGLALRHRRNVRLHAGYMLSSALPLLSPVLGRIINQVVPRLTIRGPQDFGKFGAGVQIANLIAAAIALWLWRRDPRNGRPWAIVLAVSCAQIAGFQLATMSGAVRPVLATLAGVPLGPLLVLGAALGAAAVVAGWNGAARPGRRAATA